MCAYKYAYNVYLMYIMCAYKEVHLEIGQKEIDFLKIETIESCFYIKRKMVTTIYGNI